MKPCENEEMKNSDEKFNIGVLRDVMQYVGGGGYSRIGE